MQKKPSIVFAMANLPKEPADEKCNYNDRDWLKPQSADIFGLVFSVLEIRKKLIPYLVVLDFTVRA